MRWFNIRYENTNRQIVILVMKIVRGILNIIVIMIRIKSNDTQAYFCITDENYSNIVKLWENENILWG